MTNSTSYSSEDVLIFLSTPEGCFHQVQDSGLIVPFFQLFKNTMSVSSGLITIRNPLSFEFSPIDVIFLWLLSKSFCCLRVCGV